MKNVQTLKGFRDYLPDDIRKRDYVINTLKQVFILYGFEPLETPSLEYEEILMGKYGDESEKLMYSFEDKGGRKVALRYDQTVPLARVMTQYQNDLPLPFKRYQIQNVWRAENTQKGRYREFLQCDIDIIGSSSSHSDSEIIEVAAKCFEKIGLKNYKIEINDRQIFTKLLDDKILSGTELSIFVRAIDKIKKIGRDNVLQELQNNGFEKDKANYLLTQIEQQSRTDTIEDIQIALELKNIDDEKVTFNPTLARGLDYYTGLICEIECPEYPFGSLAGGGRYDNLIGMFLGRKIPAVGLAFGFDRIIETMESLNLFPNVLEHTKILVTIFSTEFKTKSLQLGTTIRENNINAEIYFDENAKMEKQLKYADAKKIPFVAIIGPDEINNNTITLRNMETRHQESFPLREFLLKLNQK